MSEPRTGRIVAYRNASRWQEIHDKGFEFSVICQYESVEDNDCPQYPKLERYFFQPPKSISVNKGQQHYCLYEIQVHSSLFNRVQRNEGISYEMAEKFCVSEMLGSLIQPRSTSEFKLLHDLFLKNISQIGLSYRTEDIWLFGEFEINSTSFSEDYKGEPKFKAWKRPGEDKEILRASGRASCIFYVPRVT
ncbi:unnamed protein product [Enterobius vermicularis]|uniref:C-type lectin domain-containing protein n=1 Tax=Enterobius vermicularis TaxID=51028 RepID=A0A0N4UT06_ENTVE|nr:unnamed protein product [Enterobius vermicularis]